MEKYLNNRPKPLNVSVNEFRKEYSNNERPHKMVDAHVDDQHKDNSKSMSISETKPIETLHFNNYKPIKISKSELHNFMFGFNEKPLPNFHNKLSSEMMLGKPSNATIAISNWQKEEGETNPLTNKITQMETNLSFDEIKKENDDIDDFYDRELKKIVNHYNKISNEDKENVKKITDKDMKKIAEQDMIEKKIEDEKMKKTGIDSLRNDKKMARSVMIESAVRIKEKEKERKEEEKERKKKDEENKQNKIKQLQENISAKKIQKVYKNKKINDEVKGIFDDMINKVEKNENDSNKKEVYDKLEEKYKKKSNELAPKIQKENSTLNDFDKILMSIQSKSSRELTPKEKKELARVYDLNGKTIGGLKLRETAIQKLQKDYLEIVNEKKIKKNKEKAEEVGRRYAPTNSNKIHRLSEFEDDSLKAIPKEASKGKAI